VAHRPIVANARDVRSRHDPTELQGELEEAELALVHDDHPQAVAAPAA